jgi:hypothetical protein
MAEFAELSMVNTKSTSVFIILLQSGVSVQGGWSAAAERGIAGSSRRFDVSTAEQAAEKVESCVGRGL